VAQSAAETQAATALVAQAAAEASAAGLTVTAATATASAAAAVVAQAAAEASLATAQAALTTATAEKATLQTSYDALVASNATLQGSYDALVAPKSLAATTATDTLQGASGNDTFTGAAGTIAAADRFIDASAADSDTLTITHSTDPGAFTSTNIENIVMNLNGIGALVVDATNTSGVSNLTVTRGDVVVGGTTLAGNKAVRVNNVDTAEVAKITSGVGTTSVDINADGTIAATGKSGVVVDANTATTTVAVDFNATINAANAVTSVAIDGAAYTAAAELAKASVINAAKAATVTTHANLTGSVEINAAAASTITVSNAGGGATVTGSTTSAADSTISLVNVDVSGATITAGTGSATASAKQMNVILDGTALATDAATVNAAGVIALDVDATSADAVDILTLGTTGGAVTYNIATPAGGTDNTIGTINATSDVTVAGASAALTGTTIANASKVDLTSGSTGTILDADSWTGVTTIDVGYDVGAAVSYFDGQTYEFTLDQTGLDMDLYATGSAQTVTIVAGDDNGANTAVGTITLGALTVDDTDDVASGTITIEASIANLTATSMDFGAKQNLVITGDEDVNLGQTTGGAGTSINAAGSSGVITLTTTTLAPTVTTGSGADAITINGADVHTVSTNDGNDTITISATSDTSTFDGGAGNDGFTITPTTKLVAIGGVGNDTFTTGSVIDAVIIGGDGTDKITLDATRDLSAKTHFAMSGIEQLDLTAGNLTIDETQFAGDNTFAITADGDTFRVDVDTATGGTIDASGVTIATSSTAVLTYSGSAGVDALTGGVAAETFLMTAGADTIEGGATGADTITLTNTSTDVDGSLTGDVSTGVAINLGATAVDEATVLSAVTRHMGEGTTSVGVGKATFLFTNANAATVGQVNADVIQTIGSIENITGGSGNDYIVGNSGNNVINGAAGTDYIVAGDGNDTIVVAGTAEEAADVYLGGNGTDTLRATADTVFSTTDTLLTGLENVTMVGTTVDVTLTGQTEGFTITGAADANVIISGAGVDTITAEAGADTVTGAAGIDTFIVDAGDTVIAIAGTGNSGTIAGLDVITDFVRSDGTALSETLNVGGTAAKAAAAATNGTDSTLTISGTAIKSHSVAASGLVSFDDADTFSAAVTIANAAGIAAAVQYLQANDIGNAGTTVGFVVNDNAIVTDAGTTTEFVIFTQGDATGSDNNLDMVVGLLDAGATDALITANVAGANDMFIA
jgi:Ca2+-binding RTX toxin-like protein